MNPRFESTARKASLVVALTCAGEPLLAQTANRPLLSRPNDHDAYRLEAAARADGFFVGPIVDVDGDGDADFIARSLEQLRPNISSLTLGNTLDLPALLASTRDSARFAFGDFDQDGHLDMARGGIEILFGPLSAPNGRRTIVDILTLPAGSAFGSDDLLAVDLDADGDLDLLAIDRANLSPLSLTDELAYLNDGSGSFAPGTVIGSTFTPTLTVVPIQLDGVGAPELIEIAAGPLVSLRSRNPDGTYGQSPLGLGLGAGEQIFTADAADMDSDGLQDLVLTTSGTRPQLRVLRNTGGALAPLAVVQLSPTSLPTVQSATLIDPDGDGDLDVGLQFVDSIAIYENDGTGVLSLAESFRSDGADATRQFADLDGDGRSDLLEQAGPESFVAFGQPDGTLSEPRNQFLERNTGFFDVRRQAADGGLYTGDFNGDGRTDLAAFESQPLTTLLRGVTFAFNRGTGHYDTIFVTGNVGAGADFEVADLDGDGVDEIYALGSPTVFRFDPAGLTMVPNGVSLLAPIAAIDVDGDGDDEFAVINGSDFQPDLLVPDATGALVSDPFAFTTTTFPANVERPDHLTVLDLDGDGDLDLLATVDAVQMGFRGGYTLINTNGVFSLGSTLPDLGTAIGLGTPNVGDLDGDGDLDFVFTGLRTQLLNDGAGGFVLSGRAVAAPISTVLLTMEFRRDGISDLVSWSRTDPSVLEVFSNFEPMSTIELGADLDVGFGDPLNQFLRADLDDDGDPDLIIGSEVLLNSVSQLQVLAPMRLGEPTAWQWNQRIDRLDGLGPGRPIFGVAQVSTSLRPIAQPLNEGVLSLENPITVLSMSIPDTVSARTIDFTFDLSIPNLPSLAGIEIYSQAFALYRAFAGSLDMGVTASNTVRSLVTF